MEFRNSPHFRPTLAGTKPLRESVHELERQILLETLMAKGWNQSEAARKLQISERTIRYKINQLHLARS